MKRAFVSLLLVGIGAFFAGRLQSAPLPRAIRAASARPTPSTAVARGRDVYERFGCIPCHGADGKGGFANPNAETDGKVPGVVFVAEGYTDRELRLRLLDGTPTVGRSDPKGPRPPYRMPGWRGHITDTEVDDLIQYLKSLLPKTGEDKWR